MTKINEVPDAMPKPTARGEKMAASDVKSRHFVANAGHQKAKALDVKAGDYPATRAVRRKPGRIEQGA